MRKVGILVLFFVFYHIQVFSAPAYGTKLPEKHRVFMGIQTYNIFKRYLEDDFGKLRSLQHFLLLSYGVTDWFSIDLKGGAGYIKAHPLGSDELDYPTSFAGGYGLRLKFYDNREKMIRAVFGFHHISVHPKKIHVNGVKHKAVLDDWQVSLLVSKDIFSLTPYVGVKWSRVDYIHWVNEDRKRRMSDLTRSIGAILGVDIPMSSNTWINIEGHIGDEEAVAFAVMYQF